MSAPNRRKRTQKSINGLDERLTQIETNLSNNNDAALQIASNLSDLNDVATARSNLDVYSTSEVDTAIDNAKIALGTGYNVADNTERDALTDLTLNDVVTVLNDGNWVKYGVESLSPLSFYVITSKEIFERTQSASAIKSAYESNADTNAFTDADVASLAFALANVSADEYEPLVVDADGNVTLTKTPRAGLKSIDRRCVTYFDADASTAEDISLIATATANVFALAFNTTSEGVSLIGKTVDVQYRYNPVQA